MSTYIHDGCGGRRLRKHTESLTRGGFLYLPCLVLSNASDVFRVCWDRVEECGSAQVAITSTARAHAAEARSRLHGNSRRSASCYIIATVSKIFVVYLSRLFSVGWLFPMHCNDKLWQTISTVTKTSYSRLFAGKKYSFWSFFSFF